MEVRLRYRFRIYPTAPQRALLAKLFGCVRTVFNDSVEARRRAHERNLPYPSSAELQRLLITQAKKHESRAWLAEVSNAPLQQAVRDCDQAYKNFFDSHAGRRAGPRVGPPRFKRRASIQTARFTRTAFKLKANGRLYLAKIGEFKVAWSRELPSAPSSVTVLKTPTGKYFASFVVSVEPSPAPSPPELDTGIDLGLSDFAVLRGGKVIANPKFFGMVHDVSWVAFLRTLEAKAGRAGRGFAKVDRYFPSTQLCSSCGGLTGPKGRAKLKVRAWKCGICGVVHDRDRNAEINIRREGRRILAEGRSIREVCAEIGEVKRLRSAGKTGNARHGVRSPATERGRNQEPIRTAVASVTA